MNDVEVELSCQHADAVLVKGTPGYMGSGGRPRADQDACTRMNKATDSTSSSRTEAEVSFSVTSIIRSPCHRIVCYRRGQGIT